MVRSGSEVVTSALENVKTASDRLTMTLQLPLIEDS
jgi:hypothetical protein